MKKLMYLLKTMLIIFVISSIHPTTAFGVNASLSTPDTISEQVCSPVFPFEHLGDSIQQPGSDHYITLQDTAGQDSVVVHLLVFSNTPDTIRLADCQNNFPLTYGDTSFSTSMEQMISFENDTNGCPINHYFIVQAYPIYQDTLLMEICATDTPYAFLDTTFATSGIYTFHDTTALGCDSITVLNLTIHPTYNVTDTLTETICSHDLPYIFGDSTFTNSGEYDLILPTLQGCDSAFIHLNLTVNPTNYDTLTYNICSNEYPVVVDSVHTYNTAGVYFIVHDDSLVCHNVTTVIINEFPAYNDTLRVNWCAIDGAYTFADSNFTASTIYTHFDTTALGCDSITTLVLNVGESYSDTLTDTLHLCAYNLPYLFADSAITEAGTYIFDLKTVIGCDSAHCTLEVVIHDFPKDTLSIAVCANDFPYLFKDTLLPSAGVYDIHVPDTVNFGCDTILHLTVDSLPIFHDSLSVTVCANEPYVIGDSSLTGPGVYDILLQSAFGCDSMVTVTLNHYPIFDQDTLSFLVCENDLPFVYNDTSFAEAGFHKIRYATENGCDSIITIDLAIDPIIYNPDTLYEAICHSQLPYTTSFGETVNQGGLHAFTTTSTITGCDSVFYYRLTVHANPTPTISGNSHLCDGTTTNLSATAGFSAYSWNTGATSQIININQANSYTVTVTDLHGCQGSVTHTVTTAALPNVVLSSNQTICLGESATLTVSGADHYVWDNGSTNTSIEVHPTTTTTYRVTAYSALSCQRVGNVTVVVNSLPTASITGDDAICLGENTLLTAHGGSSYRWSNNVNSNTITVTNEGDYTVTVTDANGCSNTATKFITVHALPTISINGRATFCQNQSTTLTATGAVSYLWSTGETTATLTTSYAGTYVVTGTDAHGCSSTAEKEISIKQINAQITGNRHFCQGQNTTLSVSGNEAYTYQWNDGSTSSSIEIYTPGTYSVIVTNSLGCTNTISATVSEYSLPTPSITGTATICQGSTTTLRASGGVSYEWSNGSTDAYISVNESGTYYVTVTNQASCSATTSETVIVNPLPTVTINGLTSICEGGSVSLYAQSPSGMQYIWPMSGQQSPLINVTPTNTTTYTVNVTDNNGCTNSASTTISVQENPTVYLNGPTNICVGDTATLTALGGETYQWSTGTTNNSISVTQSGIYTVTVFNTHSCSATASTTLTVNNLPHVNIPTGAIICQGETTTLTASAPAGCTYLWSNNSTASSITVNQAGVYSVTTTNAQGCSTIDSVVVTSHALPTLSFGMQHTICEGESYTYQLPTNNNLTYQWSNGGAGSTITVSTAGIYTVTATNEYGCSVTASDSLIVIALPTPTIQGNTTICRGGNTILSATGGSSYVWSNGTIGPDIAVFPNTTSTYVVTVTNQYGCSASTNAVVTVNTLPTLNINGDLQFCEGGSTTLTATGASTYTWSTGSTSNSVTISEPGIYYVTARNTMNCQKTDSVTIVELSNPTITISGESLVCANTPHTLTANGGVSYVWSTGENSNSILIAPNATTTYTVTGQDAMGCESTVSKVISVESSPDLFITGMTSICTGENTTLTATGGNTYLWSTGDTTSHITTNIAGSYSVTATSSNGCTSSTSTQISINPIPDITFSGSNTLCENSTSVISAHGGHTYLWSNGSIDTAITISNGGTYTVTATNTYGCSSAESIVVTLLPAPSLEISGINILCSGSSSVLEAISSAIIYAWSTGETTPSITITPTESTTYAVTTTGSNGCSSSGSINVTVNPTYNRSISDQICQGNTYTQYGFNLPAQQEAGEFTYYNHLQSINGCDSIITLHLTVNPKPVLPETISGNGQITLHGSYLYKVEDAQHVDSYQWRVSNTHWTLSNSNSSNVYLDITQNGSGILTAQAINDCGTAEVSLEIYCNVGVEVYTNETKIQLYPVPAKDVLHVNLEDAAMNVSTVQLIDQLGHCLQAIPVTDAHLQIDCTPYSAGHYFVRFLDQDGKTIDNRKIIIRQ